MALFHDIFEFSTVVEAPFWHQIPSIYYVRAPPRAEGPEKKRGRRADALEIRHALQIIVEEAKELWERGIWVYDAHEKKHFLCRVAIVCVGAFLPGLAPPCIYGGPRMKSDLLMSPSLWR